MTSQTMITVKITEHSFAQGLYVRTLKDGRVVVADEGGKEWVGRLVTDKQEAGK